MNELVESRTDSNFRGEPGVNDLLLARAKRGDLGALEEIYRAYEGTVYAVARRLVRRPEDAEEVLQETFIEVARSLPRFRGEGLFSAWLRRIAANKALMKLRHDRSRPTQPLDDGDEDRPGRELVDTRPDSPEHRLDLESALGLLSTTSRSVVWLHDVEGFTHEEIGELMGRTPSFSKSQLARAHQRLRRYLGEAPRALETET